MTPTTANNNDSRPGSFTSGETTVDNAPEHQPISPPPPPGGAHEPSQGIDVAAAEHQFQELSRQLSTLSRVQSRASHTKHGDIEKHEVLEPSEVGEEEERFDLETHLRGSQTAEQDADIKPKHIGVIWQDLTVSGLGGVRNYIQTFPDAVVGFFNVFDTMKHIFGWGKKGQEFDILKGFRGVVKPGEMVLVLGRPGSGCTTFLKVIANQREGYTKVDGDVMYGRFSADTFGKRYRGESLYNQEGETMNICIPR